MSWPDLPLDLQKVIINDFLQSEQHALRISSKQISQFPIDLSLCCLPPSIAEIIDYFMMQRELIEQGTYTKMMRNYGIIQEIAFTHNKTIIIDPYMNGHVQNLEGDIIPFDQLGAYLKGSQLILNTNHIGVWYMIRVILNLRAARMKCNPLIADECFLKLLYQYNVNPEPILEKFLKDPSAAVTPFNLKLLTGDFENDISEIKDNDNNINERFIDMYGCNRIKSMQYLDLIDLNYEEGYLAIMVGSHEEDIPMLIALLNRGIKEGLVDTLGSAAQGGRIDIVKLLLKYGVDPTPLKGTTAWINYPQITKLLEAALIDSKL